MNEAVEEFMIVLFFRLRLPVDAPQAVPDHHERGGKIKVKLRVKCITKRWL